MVAFVGLAAVHCGLMFLSRVLAAVGRRVDVLAKKANDLQYRYGYRMTARASAGHGLFFMNYGIRARDGEEVELTAADEPDRLFIQLYHEVLAGTELRGKDVLEVSCGQGGGSRYIARSRAPRRTVGLDLTDEAVAMCRRHHDELGLEFHLGNAVALPFDAGAFDAVISVEASHRYPSFDGFVNEAARVLRPGGHLLLADLRWRPGEHEEMRRSLDRSGLELLEVEDLTPRVIASLDDYAAARRESVTAMFPKPFHAAALDSAGVPGSPIYQAFVNGTAHYTRFVLRKPDDDRYAPGTTPPAAIQRATASSASRTE